MRTRNLEKRTRRRRTYPSRVYLPLLLALVGTQVGWPAAGQEAGESAGAMDPGVLKAYLLDAFERAKQMDVAFARAIPDSALRWSPTPEVRDFAQQVVHAAGNPFIVQGVFGEAAPAFGDTALVLNDKEALAEAVSGAYDWVLERLRTLPPERLAESANLFGREFPKWRILVFALEHAMWTRGQLVPYFRLNGLRPPSVRLF
ncbi:MAG: DinB family protein [Gemmatimonadota bacterium]